MIEETTIKVPYCTTCKATLFVQLPKEYRDCTNAPKRIEILYNLFRNALQEHTRKAHNG